MPEFKGDRLSNIGDPIYDKDAVNLKSLNYKLANFTGGTSGGTIISGNYLPLSGGTLTGNTNFDNGAIIQSGGTDLYSIFSTPTSVLSTHVQPGINITTGGTSLNPIINLVSSPSINNLLFSGTATGNIISTLVLSGNTIYSGSTDLSNYFGNLQSEIISLSGLTSGYTPLTQFAGYTAITNTTLIGLQNQLNTKANLSGATFTGNIYSPIISGDTYYSGSTPLQTIIQNMIPFDVDNYLPLSGGTVTGNTNFISGLSATTLTSTTSYFTSAITMNGGLKYLDGNQNVGKIMTSDVNGNISLQTPSLAGIQVYFFQKTSDPFIGGYYEQLTTLPTRTTQTINNNGVVNNQLLTSFITLSGTPGSIFIPGSFGTINIHALQVSGTQSTQLYFQLLKRDTGGTETILTSTGNSGIITGIDNEYLLDFSISATTLNVGDRILTKVFALISGVGTAPEIQLNIEGSTASRLEIPSANVDSTNFVPYSGAMSNVYLGNYNLSANYLSGNTIYSGNTDLSTYFGNLQNQLITKANLSGATFTGLVNGTSFSGTSVSGGTYYSGSTPLQTILNNLSTGLVISSTTITSGNNGALLFQSGSTLFEDKNNLFFDSVNRNLAVGANSFDTSNPEKFKISAGTTSSVNLLYGYSNINSYTQIGIQNTSTGSSASSDFVSTSDNGTQTDGYVDLGINNSNFSPQSWGNQNDAYLYVSKTGSTGGNLFIGTNTGSKAIYFYTSGGTVGNERMRITDNNVSAGAFSSTTLSGGTIFSGSTDLSSLFATQSLTTTIQNQLATKANLSGATFTGLVNGTSFSGTSISGGTYYSGSTPLQTIISNMITAVPPTVNIGNTLFVSTTGSDSTGTRGNLASPYKTIGGALSSATTGDTVFVFAGTYTETGLFKDGINYYFANGATISPSATTSIFTVLNPTRDFNVDGFLTITSAQNGCAFDIQTNNNNINYYIKFKTITMTNVTGFDTFAGVGNTARTAIRFVTQQGNANVFGDIKITSTLNTQNAGGLCMGTDAVNLYYNGNITMTSTSPAFYSFTSSSPTRTLVGNFSSAGSVGTIYINNDRSFCSINGTVTNSSYASGVFAISSNLAFFGGLNFNGIVQGNIWLQGNPANTSQNINGVINAAINNASYIRLSSGNNNINASIFDGGFYIDGGVNVISGNIVWAGNGNIANVGALNVTNGTTFFKANSTTFVGRNWYPSLHTGGLFRICKDSNLYLTSVNGAAADGNYGITVNGGTMIVEGVIDYSTTTAAANLAPIKFTSGTLVLDGGRIINRQTGTTASSISATTNQNIKIYNNSYANFGISGGTLTNVVTGGGSLFVYTGLTE